MAGIGALTDLAPLHQPRALAGIEAVRAALPQVPAVACFDTAFHAGLPAAAATYALPAAWTRRFGLRRFGFPRAVARVRGGLRRGLTGNGRGGGVGASGALRHRVVTCHLGAGSSLAAVLDGRCVDTTMGFTPLEGLVMATRSGNVDPGLIVWLLRHGGLSVDEVSDGLEYSAGLAGLAGLPGGSGDMRDVRLAAGRGDPDARLALDVHAHRLRAQIAAMAAALGGLDTLVFTGGIGEHQAADPRRGGHRAGVPGRGRGRGRQRHRPAGLRHLRARCRGPHPGHHRTRGHRDRPPDPRRNRGSLAPVLTRQLIPGWNQAHRLLAENRGHQRFDDAGRGQGLSKVGDGMTVHSGMAGGHRCASWCSAPE